IIVDDGSTDSTQLILEKIHGIKFLSKKNGGKGSAIRLGLQEATGDVILIQDADLEYSPTDIPALLKTMIENNADAVYGSRFMKKRTGKKIWLHEFGNRFLALLTTLLFFKKITDPETGYKLVKKKVLNQLELKSNQFDIEIEITAKLLKNKYTILEVPINFSPRTISEGKKITWKDGIVAVKKVIKYRFSN
ncbi:MAG: glycosyltransferase family 2 protein, partial [Candidatus Diapherotrites archaeon]|nr:glycosyltransferase family 2 protein [Candidatus Diapherotrites archaeon]